MQNLATRSNDGFTVTLGYDEKAKGDDSRDLLHVHVSSAQYDFTLHPEPHNALDCFNHPFAYADRALTSGRMDRVAA